MNIAAYYSVVTDNIALKFKKLYKAKDDNMAMDQNFGTS